MANYNFTRHGENVPTTLAEIDEAMRKDLKLEPDADNFCWLYRWVEEVGFAILMNQGGAHVTEISYKRWRKTTRLDDDKQFIENETLIKKYLYGEYRFTGWR